MLTVVVLVLEGKKKKKKQTNFTEISVEVFFVHQGWMWQVANMPSLTKAGEKQSSAFT